MYEVRESTKPPLSRRYLHRVNGTVNINYSERESSTEDMLEGKGWEKAHAETANDAASIIDCLKAVVLNAVPKYDGS